MTTTTRNVSAEPGSVSSETMRPEDLIPCFIDVLDDLKEDLAQSVTTTTTAEDAMAVWVRVGQIDDFLGRVEQNQQAEDYYESEGCQFDLEELFGALGEFAPEDCCFGSHPGDGADYGFWA